MAERPEDCVKGKQYWSGNGIVKGFGTCVKCPRKYKTCYDHPDDEKRCLASCVGKPEAKSKQARKSRTKKKRKLFDLQERPTLPKSPDLQEILSTPYVNHSTSTSSLSISQPLSTQPISRLKSVTHNRSRMAYAHGVQIVVANGFIIALTAAFALVMLVVVIVSRQNRRRKSSSNGGQNLSIEKGRPEAEETEQLHNTSNQEGQELVSSQDSATRIGGDQVEDSGESYCNSTVDLAQNRVT